MNKNPVPSFHFQVEWGGTQIGFSEVSGLEMETEVIEYRQGASPVYTPSKMPGQTRFSDIILSRGICRGDNEFFEWWKQNALINEPEKRDLTISILNEQHEPVVVWRVVNAWIRKLKGPVLNAYSSEVAIEEMVITHEGLNLLNG